VFTYKLSLQAEEDIIRIYEYGFYKFGIAQADKYYENLFICFTKIAQNPYMFPSAEEIKKGYRYCVCGIDTIYYRVINDNRIEIITIIGKQDFS
jgi:toxin ParE1/3/4